MEKRIGVVGIIVEDMDSITKLNAVLHDHAEIILGRLGVPYRERKINVISLIVEGTTEQIDSLTDKLNELQGVSVKSNISQNEC